MLGVRTSQRLIDGRYNPLKKGGKTRITLCKRDFKMEPLHTPFDKVPYHLNNGTGGSASNFRLSKYILSIR